MAKNANLTQAKRAKNDEFYTQYSDIEKEVFAYITYNPDVFRDKTILCPCDDYEWSNFTKYFTDNFQKFGLKKLISTCYDNSGILLGARGKIQIITKDGCKNGLLEGDGDFRSAEVTRLRDEADIVITNPPFSLFREFLAWLVEKSKKFAVISSINAITYKEVFPLIKNNILWLGNNHVHNFVLPNNKIKKFGNICWFTNIDYEKRHKSMILVQKYNPVKYPKYDNYDAINVDQIQDIPCDYEGVMGVPITFLDKYCPEQFEIMGLTSGRNEFKTWPIKRYINPIQINKDGSETNGSKANTRATILLDSIPEGVYYKADNASKPFEIVYARILIQAKRGKQ